MNKKAKTKKELLDELTALQQELENFQSANAGLQKDKETLEKREKFISSIFSSIQEGISVIDKEMNILFVNPTMERWFPDVRPLIGKKCYQAYHGREQVCEACPCRQTLQTGQVANEIIPVLDTKGEISGWSQHFSFPILDPGTGQISGIIEYIRNITKHKQVEDALKESEEKYRSILENLADGYFEVDLTGSLTFFNEALEKIFDYSRDELMGMNNRFYTDSENAKKIYQAFNRAYRTGEPVKGVRFETITKKKTRRNLELSISLIRDASKKPVGFRGIARDITDLIQTQTALKESEERYRTIIETIEDAYYEVDLAGNFTFFNEAMFRLWGYPMDETLGMNYRQYTDVENTQKLFEAFSRVYQTGEPIRSIQYNAFNKNREIKNIVSSVSLFRDSSGKPAGFRGISKDITDLIQVQTALKESEERYRTIIETIEDGYYEVDLAGNMTFFNDTMVRIHEYSREELLGMNNRQYTDAENAKILFKAFNHVYRTGEPSKSIHYEVITKTGERKNVETSISLIRDHSGKPIGFRGITRDVTDLFQAQRALEESEERYRTIIETMEEGYYENDLAGNLTFVNETMARFLGYSSAEMQGMNNRKYIDAENSKKLYQAFNQVYRTGKPAKGILYEVITKNGEKRYVETSPSLIRNQSGNPVGFRGVSRDVTEFIQIQNTLRESEERYRTIIETIADGYYEVDLAGNMTFFNDQMAKIYGYPKEALMGMNNRVYTDAENAKKMYQAFNRVYRTGEPDSGVRFETITSEKTKRNMELSISLIRDLSGKPVGFRGISRDITDLIQIQNELQRSEERYRTIIETIEDGYYEVDLEGRLTFFNDAMGRINGYSREEMMGMHARDYTEAENTDLLTREFIQVYRTKTPSKGIQYEIFTKNKEKKNVETSVSLIRDHSGKPIGFRGIARDITDLIKIQQKFKESEERYRTIIETIEDGYYEVNLAGNLTYFNDTMVRIHEYSREELMGMNNRQYTDAENAKILFKAFNRVYRTGESSKGTQYEIITKTGGRKNLESSVTLIRGPQGNPIGFRGIVRDVTELRQAQKDLQTSEERFRVAAESSNDFIYEWDLETGQLEWFGNAVNQLGHMLGELPVTNVAFVKKVYPEDLEPITQAVRRHLKQGEPHLEEYRMVGKEGNLIQMKSAGMGLRDETGRVYKWIGTLSDITERKKAEQALQTSEERFRVAAESSNDFIYEWDLESGQINWFGKAVEQLGNMLGEFPVTAVDFAKLIHPEDLERISFAVRNHLRHGKPYLEEYRMTGRSGDIIHVKGAGMGLRDETGRVYKWVGAISDITERKRAEEELKDSLDKLHKAMGGIIQAMALTVESKDPYTAGHQQRVSKLARNIGQEMGLSKDQVEAIRMAGVVHDLGKISVPAEILSKPTKLSDLEFSLIKGHSQTSYEILKDVEFPWPIAEIALQHHERMNGSGYPAGLKGEEILIEAQVLMVADVVEAIASHRPYRAALGIELALDEISKNKGKLYNPDAVDACLRVFREKGFSFD